MGGVVPPRPCPRELGHRHDLDRIDAEPLQMSQTGHYAFELAGLGGVLLVVERADMQFVDDELVPRREMEVVPLPVEARVIDNGVADRGGHLAGIRVDARERALRRGQEKPVRIADTGLGHVGVPGAMRLGVHGMRVAVPVVKRSNDGDALGMRRPHAERDSSRVRQSSHARDRRCIVHGWFLTTRAALPGSYAAAVHPYGHKMRTPSPSHSAAHAITSHAAATSTRSSLWSTCASTASSHR
jgi:hypothetical protein